MADVDIAKAASLAFVGARGNRSTTTAITTATWTAVPFDAEDFDSDVFHDNSTNPSRFTIPTGKGGKYLVSATALWATSATGYRYRAVAKNGTRVAHLVGAGLAVNGVAGHISDVIDCAAGDYLELHVYQDSGGNLNIQSASYMAVTFLG